jgi:hypothetical protein
MPVTPEIAESNRSERERLRSDLLMPMQGCDQQNESDELAGCDGRNQYRE